MLVHLNEVVPTDFEHRGLSRWTTAVRMHHSDRPLEMRPFGSSWRSRAEAGRNTVAAKGRDEHTREDLENSKLSGGARNQRVMRAVENGS